MLLGVQTDDERWDVDDLLANADVALLDQDTGVVDGLGETELVDTGLETTLQEIFDLQGQDVIELHAGFVEDTDTDETSDEGVAFEKTLGVLLIEGQELTVAVVSLALAMLCLVILPGSTSNLGQLKLDTPHFTLVAQTIFAHDLEFGVAGVRLDGGFQT